MDVSILAGQGHRDGAFCYRRQLQIDLMHSGLMRHRCMHVRMMMVMDRNHADGQLRDMVIFIAIIDAAVKNPPAKPGINFELLDGLNRQLNATGLFGIG